VFQVPDEEEGYVAAQIKSTSGDQTTVTIVGGNEASYSWCLPQKFLPTKFLNEKIFFVGAQIPVKFC
jgi:hypothetical protein